MAKGFAIHNAPTNHGGIIPSTQVRSSQQGNLFVRAGDGHFCPKCKCWSTVIKSHDHVIMDGKPVAYAGDKLTCGATIQPQQSHVVGDSGGGNFDSNTTSFQTSNMKQTENFIKDDKSLHGIVYQLVDEKTNQPISKIYYQIIDNEGNIIEGETDENGHTKEITTGSSTQKIQFLTYDLSQPLPPLD